MSQICGMIGGDFGGRAECGPLRLAKSRLGDCASRNRLRVIVCDLCQYPFPGLLTCSPPFIERTAALGGLSTNSKAPVTRYTSESRGARQDSGKGNQNIEYRRPAQRPAPTPRLLPFALSKHLAVAFICTLCKCLRTVF